VSGQDAAIAAARRGWAVFPCRPDDKRPAVDRWEERACSDLELLARYWPSDRHNVGIACGPSKLVVVDLDTHGALPEDWRLPGIVDGRDVLAQLAEWAGQPWPSTRTVMTPSGGWHLYYKAPAGPEVRNSASLIGPLIDIRGSGGYVVSAGSAVGGRAYEILDDQDPLPLPAWLAQMLAPRREGTRPHDGAASYAGAPSRLRGLLRTVASAPEGQRNHALHWAACRAADMAAVGETDTATVAEALVTAAVSAGLPEYEARRTVASGLRGGGR